MKEEEVGKLLSMETKHIGEPSRRNKIVLKRAGRDLTVNGGRIGEKMEFDVAHAIHLPGNGDRDQDGVPDMYDCQPLNPDEDGFWGDIGRAVKERTRTEIEDVKERALERVHGRPIAARAALKDIEREEEWEEEKRIRKAAGKRKAQMRYGTTTTTKKKKKDETTYRGSTHVVEPRKAKKKLKRPSVV